MQDPLPELPELTPARGATVPLWVAAAVVVGAVAVTAVVTGAFILAATGATQNAGQIDTETFFRLKVDKARGDELRPGDVESVEVPAAHVEEFFADTVRESDAVSGMPAGGFPRYFTVSAKRGELLREGMFLRENGPNIGEGVLPGNRLVTLPISTDSQPPNLSSQDLVDLYANVPSRSGLQSVLVMERMPIRLVGNRIVVPGEGTGRPHVERVGSITLEVNRDQVRPLADIQSRIAGNEFFIAIHGPMEGPGTIPVLEDGQINPEVLELLGLD